MVPIDVDMQEAVHLSSVVLGQTLLYKDSQMLDDHPATSSAQSRGKVNTTVSGRTCERKKDTKVTVSQNLFL